MKRAVLLLAASLWAATPAYAQEETSGETGEAPTDETGEETPAPPSGPTLVAPRLVEAPELSLPEDAEPLPPESEVVLTLTIGADGRVMEATVFSPVREDVDALVLEAAPNMVFEPATRNGDAIPARIRFRFRVSPPEPPPEDPEAGAEPEAEAPHLDTEAIEGFDTEVSELGVVAVAERPEAGAAARITLQAEELTTVPGTFGEPLRVVETLPGVVRSPFGLGFFVVRGAAFNNTGFFVDGFQVPLLYHLGAGPAVISSRFINELNFYPGGYPSSFGRFSAGIISVETAPPPADRLRGELEVDLFRASALIVVPFEDGRGSVAAAFRRSYYDILLPLVLDGLDLSYTDYQVRADYRVNEHMQLSLFVFGSDDRLDQSGTFGTGVASEGVQNSVRYDFQRMIATLRLRLPGRVRLKIAGMLGRNGTGFESSQPGQDPLGISIENTYASWRLDTELPWPGIDEMETHFGLDVQSVIFAVGAQAFTPAGLGEYPRPIFTPQSSSVSATVARTSAALYVDQIIRLGTLQLSLASRFDYMRYGDVSEVYIDPRAVARWQVVPELLLKAATGLFTQPPSSFQLSRTGGNPELPPERSWQTSGGAELTLPENVEIQSTFYYTQFFDVARQRTTIVATEQGPERRFFAADVEGRAYGLELLIRRRVEQGFYGWLSYTLSRSERRTDQGSWVPFAFDQTHVLNVAASYAFDGWRFGARFQVATGRVTNSLVSTTYDADEDEIDPSFRSLGERIQPFHRLDIRIDRDFDIGPVRGSVYLDVQNIYNAPNNEGILYSFDYSQTANLPGIPILPTIGIRGTLQ
ncbi:MAG: TonB-dependent receptor [Sandaracinaceae bacterium]